MARANRRTAFDLHVLSMPPAFVLSQDQTLMFNPGGSQIHRGQSIRINQYRPMPRTEHEPIKGHQTLVQDDNPSPHGSTPHNNKPHLTARPTALKPPPAHPFLSYNVN